MKDFAPHQQALELRELGFDEPCFGYYEDNNLTITFPSTSSNGWKWVGNSIIPAKNTKVPLYQQAFRWFREKQYYSEITTECTQADGSIGFSWRIWKPWLIEEWSPENGNDEWSYKTYEEAELACLRKLIEIVKTKQL
jgi:hypothetical protein